MTLLFALFPSVRILRSTTSCSLQADKDIPALHISEHFFLIYIHQNRMYVQQNIFPIICLITSVRSFLTSKVQGLQNTRFLPVVWRRPHILIPDQIVLQHVGLHFNPLTHQFSAGSSLVPRQSSMHSSWCPTQTATKGISLTGKSSVHTHIRCNKHLCIVMQNKMQHFNKFTDFNFNSPLIDTSGFYMLSSWIIPEVKHQTKNLPLNKNVYNKE